MQKPGNEIAKLSWVRSVEHSSRLIVYGLPQVREEGVERRVEKLLHESSEVFPCGFVEGNIFIELFQCRFVLLLPMILGLVPFLGLIHLLKTSFTASQHILPGYGRDFLVVPLHPDHGTEAVVPGRGILGISC